VSHSTMQKDGARELSGASSAHSEHEQHVQFSAPGVRGEVTLIPHPEGGRILELGHLFVESKRIAERIDPRFYEELEKQFGKNWRDKKAFNWQEEFPEVFKQGGFDVIIGNPPYLKELDNKELFQEIRKSNFGKYYQGKMDFWYFFLHRSIEILKDGGVMAFITNSYFLKSAGAITLINHLQDEMVLKKAVDFQDIPVFEGVSGRHLIHIWEKAKDKNSITTKYIKLNKNSFSGVVDENNSTELSYVEVIKDSSINFEAKTHTNKDTLLLLTLTNPPN